MNKKTEDDSPLSAYVDDTVSGHNEKDTSADNSGSNPFSPYFGAIFSGRNEKDTSLDKSSSDQSRLEDFLGFNYTGSTVTQKYHGSILKQAQGLTALFAALFSAVTVFICVAVMLIILKGYDAQLLFPLIASVFADFFSAGLIVVMQNVAKSRDDFFRESVKAEYFAKVIGMIHQIDNEEKRLPLVQGVLDSYLVQFHQDGTEPEFFNKLVELVNTLSDDEKKHALIEKLMEYHFKQPAFPPTASTLNQHVFSEPTQPAAFPSALEDDGKTKV